MAKQVGPASGKPRTSLAFEAAFIDWPRSRVLHHGPGPQGPTREAEDTFAVPSLFAITDSEPVPVPRPYGRVKAKPPSAVRFAQP